MDALTLRAKELADACRAMPAQERRGWLDAQKLDPSLRAAVEERLREPDIEIAPTVIWQKTVAAAEALRAGPAGPRPDVTIEQPGAQLPLEGAPDAPAPQRAPDTGQDPLLGKVFAGVQIERIVGSGGMGRVYVGRDQKLNSRVAIKVLLRTQRDESVRLRFDREARLLEKLRHPSIASVLRSGVESDGDVDTPYIVMEYVSGVQTISDYVFQERLGIRETIELFLNACDGVGFAHKEGYIHRDIKPPNILVDRHGRVKVIDFGVARAASHDVGAATVRTQTGQIVGTMQYMSPEQFLADPRQIDKRSDVYALGAVLFELLTGVQPHDIRGMPVHEAARTVCERDAPDVRTYNPRIDDDLAAIVGGALSREKGRRPEDANDLARRLRAWIREAEHNPDRVKVAAHPDREFMDQTGVEAAPTKIISNVGGGGGGVKLLTPTPAGRPGRGRTGPLGRFVMVALALVAVGATLVALDIVPAKQLLQRVRSAVAGSGAAPLAETDAGEAATGDSGEATDEVLELRVVSAPVGATVTVDGEPRGVTPAVVLVPGPVGDRVDIEVKHPGYRDASVFWKPGMAPIVAANLDPVDAPAKLPRIFTLDVDALPAGAKLQLAAPQRRELGSGTWCVEVVFDRAGEGWATGAIELEALSASGAPLNIAIGTTESNGRIHHEVSADEASQRLRVRVR